MAMRSMAELRLTVLLFAVAAGMSPPARADEVPYVSTPPNVVAVMLAIAEVGPKDYVVDLGSGDGRIVIAAAKRYGARALGIDYDRTLIDKSRETAAREGVSERATFLFQDIFTSDFRDATVVTMYLLPEVNLALRPRLLFDLRPGTRVVSHDWDMADWEPDRRLVIKTPGKTVWPLEASTVYLWIVPARVAGYWRGTLNGPQGTEPVVIEFQQRFQNASARVWLGQWSLAGAGRLRGERLSLTLDLSPWMSDTAPLHFSLRVVGSRLEGEALDGNARYILRASRLAD
jgi:SAM-dependent methyltransferase